MEYFLIIGMLSLVGIVGYLNLYQKKNTMMGLMRREPVAPADQLSPFLTEPQQLHAAISLWNKFAKAYDIDPSLLRVDDKLEDITASDLLGDRGLEIEEELTNHGINQPLNGATLLEMISLYVKQQYPKSD